MIVDIYDLSIRLYSKLKSGAFFRDEEGRLRGPIGDNIPAFVAKDWAVDSHAYVTKLSRKSGNEHLLTLDPKTGETIGEWEGTKYGVEYRTPKGMEYVTLHTHGKEMTFSKDDLTGFIDSDKEPAMRVITPKGDIYVMNKPRGFKSGGARSAKEIWDEHARRLSGKYYFYGLKGKKEEAAKSEYYHEVVSAVAKDLGLDYMRYMR